MVGGNNIIVWYKIQRRTLEYNQHTYIHGIVALLLVVVLLYITS